MSLFFYAKKLKKTHKKLRKTQNSDFCYKKHRKITKTVIYVIKMRKNVQKVSKTWEKGEHFVIKG